MIFIERYTRENKWSSLRWASSEYCNIRSSSKRSDSFYHLPKIHFWISISCKKIYRFRCEKTSFSFCSCLDSRLQVHIRRQEQTLLELPLLYNMKTRLVTVANAVPNDPRITLLSEVTTKIPYGTTITGHIEYSFQNEERKLRNSNVVLLQMIV